MALKTKLGPDTLFLQGVGMATGTRDGPWKVRRATVSLEYEWKVQTVSKKQGQGSETLELAAYGCGQDLA